ncbi:hypothetical protein BDV97DRAFT_28668 [Delphinella strobiligena]|nr:hypothetical protein BDV97DRAFT_28668 [Delphinella strobiligena]
MTPTFKSAITTNHPIPPIPPHHILKTPSQPTIIMIFVPSHLPNPSFLSSFLPSIPPSFLPYKPKGFPPVCSFPPIPFVKSSSSLPPSIYQNWIFRFRKAEPLLPLDCRRVRDLYSVLCREDRRGERGGLGWVLVTVRCWGTNEMVFAGMERASRGGEMRWI